VRALTFSRFGGPDVLRLAEVADPAPRDGHAIVRLAAIGLNFADIYRRQGRYHLAGEPPYIAGYEGAGTIESLVGEPPDPRLVVGARVAFADSPFANAELASVALDRLIPLPADIALDTAAALLLQGLTAQYLVRDSHPLRAGETVAVHAAAGGVGQLLVQLARMHGARVLGLASTAEKAAVARDAGATEVFLYDCDWAAALRAATGGLGVDVVYDSVGTTLLASLAATCTGGHVVFFGMAGGQPPLVDPAMLMDTSKSLTGGDLWNVLTSHAERVARSEALFAWVRSGALVVHEAARFALADGAEAHRFLESRRSTGKVLLVP
jgi:NADPH2:quinone reductase